MTFTWSKPPWLRTENCTHMALTLTDAGAGQVAAHCESVRGDDATEALADLLMGPTGGAGSTVTLPNLIAVVVRRGIDVMWMAQPPIQVTAADQGRWEITVAADTADVTVFAAPEIHDFDARLRAEYGSG
jgi:hypothetical protein